MDKKTKPDFLMSKSWAGIWDELPDEQAAYLIRRIYDYQTRREDRGDMGNGAYCDFVYKATIKPFLEAKDREYQAKCKQNSDNRNGNGKDKGLEQSLPAFGDLQEDS